MIVKRNVSDSQKAEVRKDKVKMLRNCLHTRAWRCEHLSGMQHDAGARTQEMETLKTLSGMRADAAPEQMNSLVQSKTEVLEKIEESLRPLCMVEDLDDDEVMELCILSNELNACEIIAVLNPSKFASRVRNEVWTPRRFRSGFDDCKSQRNDVGPHS